MSALQEALRSRGFDPGRTDGVFGPKTQAAVQAFQRSQGITVDGIVGPQTFGKLGNATTAAISAAATTNPAQFQQLASQPGALGEFLRAAMAQDGDTYRYGAEVDLNAINPSTFDCSELVEWAARQAGVTMPDGSMNQLEHVRNAGTEMSVEEALRTPGALLFREGSSPHVAISLGDGRTMEARGTRDGVGVFDGAADRTWTAAGTIPGM